MPTAVIAFGGNAFVPEGASGAYDEQADLVGRMVHAVAEVRRRGYRVVVVHGNGPQVGALAIQQEEGAALVAPQPLFVLDAMTQAQLGHMLAMAVRNVIDDVAGVAALVTHVIVSGDDGEFARPTKPIGPFYDPDEAARLADDRGWTVRPVSDRASRRVVASPAPLEVLEMDSVRALVDAGIVVIAGGGGGIPMLRTDDGLRGVDAVIDKDRVAAHLAHDLGAELLVLVTGVPAVATDHDTPRQRAIDEMTVAQARAHHADGQFPMGSMGPKVESAAGFVSRGGRLAVITSDRHVGDALDGRHGTRVIADIGSPTGEVAV